MSRPAASALAVIGLLWWAVAAPAQPLPAATDAAAPAADAHPTPADDESSFGAPRAVIPPGQEQLIADMVGRGETLPGGCKLTAGEVHRTSVRATYACEKGGEVVFELRHPTSAPPGTTLTSRFAVMLLGGSPPPGLADALVGRIRSREAAFEWKWLGAPPSRFSATTLVLLVVIGVVLAVVVAVVRARTLTRRTRPG